MADVMWATPDDHRILLAPDRATADFVTRIYDFDEVRVTPVTVAGDDRRTTVADPDLGLDLVLRGGRRWPIPVRRPLWVTRWVEAPIARRVMGVDTHGTSAAGAVEWYQASGWRWVESGAAEVAGSGLGELRRIDRAVGVGFSEPPERPSIVSVRVTIDLPGEPDAAGDG